MRQSCAVTVTPRLDTEIGRNYISTKRWGIMHRAGACSFPFAAAFGVAGEADGCTQKRCTRGALSRFVLQRGCCAWGLILPSPGGIWHSRGRAEHRPIAASVSFDGVRRARTVMASCCHSKRRFVFGFFFPQILMFLAHGTQEGAAGIRSGRRLARCQEQGAG